MCTGLGKNSYVRLIWKIDIGETIACLVALQSKVSVVGFS